MVRCLARVARCFAGDNQIWNFKIKNWKSKNIETNIRISMEERNSMKKQRPLEVLDSDCKAWQKFDLIGDERRKVLVVEEEAPCSSNNQDKE